MFSGMYLFFSELCKGIGTFSPRLFSFEHLNEKGFFAALINLLLEMGKVFSITAGTSEPSTRVAGILGENPSK